MEMQGHAYALAVSGYTILRGQVAARELALLREAADRALARSAAVQAQGIKLRHTFAHQYYNAARCMYCWSDANVRLLDHPAIHELAALAMDSYQLWDNLVMAALPAPEQAVATTAWHRDFMGMVHGAPTAAYLWFNVCLDEITSLNGATWVVPGSHHHSAAAEPATPADARAAAVAYPTRQQVCASAGDIVVFNPTILHDSGHNHSHAPRRLLNVGLCHRSLPPLMNHWQIAGAAIRQSASPRLRALLNGGAAPLEATWSALPAGWQMGD